MIYDSTSVCVFSLNMNNFKVYINKCVCFNLGKVKTTRLANELARRQRRFHHGPRPSHHAAKGPLPVHQRANVRWLPRGLHARSHPKRPSTIAKTNLLPEQTENPRAYTPNRRLHESLDKQPRHTAFGHVKPRHHRLSEPVGCESVDYQSNDRESEPTGYFEVHTGSRCAAK